MLELRAIHGLALPLCRLVAARVRLALVGLAHESQRAGFDDAVLETDETSRL